MAADRFTNCHIISGDKLLLKKATRGISRGRWNCAGGMIEPGETPEEAARREVREETGLNVWDLFNHGILHMHYPGRRVDIYLFSTRSFEGTPNGTEEGELAWFDVSRIPYDQMWSDDEYWIDLMLRGEHFDATFYFDRASRVIRHKINILD